MRHSTLLTLLIAVAVVTGCSFSKSSESISNSISKSSESISDSSTSSSGDDDSSPPPEEPQDAVAYQADVAQLAATYARSGGDIGALRSAVSQLAVKRGITNWEADPMTVQAIGRGVGDGGMDDEQFAAFSKELFGENLSKQSELSKGYQQATGSPS